MALLAIIQTIKNYQNGLSDVFVGELILKQADIGKEIMQKGTKVN